MICIQVTKTNYIGASFCPRIVNLSYLQIYRPDSLPFFFFFFGRLQDSKGLLLCNIYPHIHYIDIIPDHMIYISYDDRPLRLPILYLPLPLPCDPPDKQPHIRHHRPGHPAEPPAPLHPLRDHPAGRGCRRHGPLNVAVAHDGRIIGRRRSHTRSRDRLWRWWRRRRYW